MSDERGEGQLLAKLDRKKPDEDKATDQLRVSVREFKGAPLSRPVRVVPWSAR